MLRDQVIKAVAGKSNFCLADGERAIACTAMVDFSPYKDHIVIWPLDNSIESVWNLLKAISEGVIPVVISGKWPAMKIEQIKTQFPNFGYFNGTDIELSNSPTINEDGLFIVLLTSGSTGVPQAIATTETRLQAGIEAIHKHQKLDQVKSTGILLPVCYSYSLINQLLWAVYYEKKTYLNNTIMGPFEPFKYLDYHKTEMVCMVAAQIGLISNIDYSTMPILSAVKVVNFAGSPFPMNHLGDLRKLFPNARFINNYGCTEAMPRLTMREVKDGSDSVSNVGQVIGDIEIKISGEHEGPIMFRGSSTALGKLLENGKVELFPEWIYSGDHGKLLGDTLFVSGRRDQVVKIQGERFSLAEIENAVQKTDCDHAAVWLEETSGKIILVLGGRSKPSINQIRKACRENLHKHMWPKEIYYLNEWPLNANSKTDRVKIKQLYQLQKLDKY